jgi:hypothetical protein
VECCCISEDARDWIAKLIEDDEEQDAESSVVLYCPACAEWEFERQPRSLPVVALKWRFESSELTTTVAVMPENSVPLELLVLRQLGLGRAAAGAASFGLRRCNGFRFLSDISM